MARKRKSIMFLPGNSFVTRNYLSTPFLEQLVKMKEAYNLDVYFAGIESNPVSREIMEKVSFFLSNHDISLIPLVSEKGYFRERFFWKIRQDYLHKSSIYRFNDFNSFVTHKRYKDITANFKDFNHKLLWRTDVWPSYLGFPFPKSKKILEIMKKLLTSKIISGHHSVKKIMNEISPDILFIGDSQTPISFTYAVYALMNKSYVIGNVRTWDHLTKNGPLIPNLSEYWVWNDTMKDEMTKFHNVKSDLIEIVGSPQFDNYFNVKNLNTDSILAEKNISSEQLIKNIIIENEIITNEKYIAKIKINLNRKRIINLLRNNKINYTDIQSKQFLVVSSYNINFINIGLNKKKSFNNFLVQKLTINKLINYTFPNLDANDRYILPYEKIINEDISRFDLILNKYNLNQLILIKILNSVTINQINVNILIYKNQKFVNIGKINFDNRDFESQNELFDIISDNFFIYMNEWWRKEYQINNSEFNIIQCKILSKNFENLIKIKYDLNNLSQVKHIKAKKIQLNTNIFDIFYYGSFNVLLKSLSFSNITYKDINGCIVSN